MTEQVRLHNFLRALNHYMMYEASVIDFDEDGECIYDESENFTYAMLMETKEWHLLGTDTVKKYIHMWRTDWPTMSKVLAAEGIY